MQPEFWKDLYPENPWPGWPKALQEMVLEIQSLRLLADEVVASVVENEQRLRNWSEVQRAHDLVGRFCVETNDAHTMEHVSALCWVLKHNHNTAFPQILEMVEQDLQRRGITVVRLPEVVDPAKERQ